MKRVAWIGILLAVALVVGLWLGSAPWRRSVNQERNALNLQFARTMLPFKVAFNVLLGVVLLATLGGLGWSIVRWINRRANTVYPDRSGLYPLREERVGRARVIHDPNRTLAGTTVFAVGNTPVWVQHALPENQVGVQSQVVGQAQAAQALRAAVSGAAPLPTPQGFPVQLFDRHVSRPMPEVKALPWEPSHIERLLLQDGEPLALDEIR